MTERVVFLVCAAACLVALSLPAVPEPKPRIVYRTPLMQLLCDSGKDGRTEFERQCRARRKSI